MNRFHLDKRLAVIKNFSATDKVRRPNIRLCILNIRLCILTTLLSTGFIITSCATPVGEIESWPVTAAQKSQFSGVVVDVLCELNGNCADDCGAGKRQLAIRTSEQKLGTVLVAKNLSNYSGAADELWQFCGQQVELNGLFTEHRGIRFFQVQNIQNSDGQWQRATQYLSAWAERNGKSPQQAQNWHENDDRIKEIIERDGRLGLGTETDREFFK